MHQRGCRTEERTIDGRRYTVTQMAPTESVPIQARLVTILSGVVGPLLKQSEGIESAIGDAIAGAGVALNTHMPPDEFLAFAKQLTCNGLVRADGEMIDFDQEFAGDACANLYPLMSFVLEVNYAKFFIGIGGNKIADLVADKLKAVG